MKSKVWRWLRVQLKEIERIEAQLRFVNPKSKIIYDASFRLKEEKVSDMSFDWLTSVFYSFGWSSWKIQMYEYGAIYLQIKQGLIQIKGVHFLYQL
jgi:hypothetical protein